MKDYTKLFEIKFEKDKLEDTLLNITKVESGVIFYDDPEFKLLGDIKQKIWDKWSKLKVDFEEEKKNFSNEELKELNHKYSEKYRK